MNRLLTPEIRKTLTHRVSITRSLDEKDRLRVILAYDEGYDIQEIVDILKLSKSTIHNYLQAWRKNQKLTHDPKGGSESHLSVCQEKALRTHLTTVTYLYAKQIAAYVLSEYGVRYSVAGMTQWLKRNKFTYKRPQSVPGKLETSKQTAFISYYEALKQNLKPEEGIMFMDAVHPVYQSQAVCGWIPKGMTKTIATTNKQFRLHLNGAIELGSMRLKLEEYDTLDSEAVLHFLKKLKETTPYQKLHVICDNGRANKNKLLAAYLAKTPQIVLHYLPPYSPNLNPIERLWKIMRQQTTYNRYYESYTEFKETIRTFFAEKIETMEPLLRARITDKFQTIIVNPVQLSS